MTLLDPTTPIRDRTALEDLLRDLPAPPEGCVRVYRGQTADFRAMQPSACRPGAPTIGPLWEITLLQLRDSVLGMSAETSTLQTLMNFGFWFKVLAQHYGPGSEYLDVTSSVDVALWFALNRTDTRGADFELALEQPGLEWTSIAFSGLRFSAHVDAPGFFYVLDVPMWSGQSLPRHGDFVDLEHGPAFVANCPRVRQQCGGLLRGDARQDRGDLSGYYVCPPIRVTRPFQGAPLIGQEPGALFPSAADDTWYQTLLRAPLVLRPDASKGFEYRQSLGVYVVMPRGTREEALEVVDRQIRGMAPLSRPFLRTKPEIRKELRDVVGADPEDATWIQLDPPLVDPLPPVRQWCQGALAAGLDDRVQPRDFESGEPLPAIPLREVLVELSPLEKAFSAIDPGEGVITSLWMVREEVEFQWVLFGVFPRDGGPFSIGPVKTRFSESTGVFELEEHDGYKPLLDSVLPEYAIKVFFVALDVVRGLSPDDKPDAYPSFSRTSDDGWITTLLPLRSASTVLTRTRVDPSDMRLHFLGHADTMSPYRGPTNELPRKATLLVKTRDGIGRLGNLRELYGHVHELHETSGPIELPDRKADGFSETIADFLLERYPPYAAL